jgi:hypothetical protein
VAEPGLSSGSLGPGQLGHPLEVGADHLRLGRVGCGQSHGARPRPGLRRSYRRSGCACAARLLGLALRALAELPPLAHLLAQELLALVARQLLAGGGLDLGLHGRDRHLAAQQCVDLAQAADGVADLQDLLRLLDPQAQVRSDQVRQPARVVHAARDGQDLGRQVLERQELFELLAHAAHQCLDLDAERRGRLGGQRLDRHVDVRLGAQELGDADLGEALHQHLQPAVGQAHHAHDHADHADRVEVVRSGLVDLGIALRHERQQPVALDRRLDRVRRDVAADEQGQDHRREDDGVANGQERELTRDLEGAGGIAFHEKRNRRRAALA